MEARHLLEHTAYAVREDDGTDRCESERCRAVARRGFEYALQSGRYEFDSGR